MNWDAVGAIGEVAGAIAVFATLFYLAVQLRNSTRQSQRDAIRHTWDSLNTLESWHLLLEDHPDKAFVEQQHKNIADVAEELLAFPATR